MATTRGKIEQVERLRRIKLAGRIRRSPTRNDGLRPGLSKTGAGIAIRTAYVILRAGHKAGKACRTRRRAINAARLREAQSWLAGWILHDSIPPFALSV
jgi:hypothetical protein